MKVLVCGGRTYEDSDTLSLVLDTIHVSVGIERIIHGDAGKFYDYPSHYSVPEGALPGFWVGADKLAGQWARRRGVSESFHKADWKKYGRKAGPIRNQYMLDHHQPDLVVAFPGGRGTADMVKRAKAGGYKVYQVAEES